MFWASFPASGRVAAGKRRTVPSLDGVLFRIGTIGDGMGDVDANMEVARNQFRELRRSSRSSNAGLQVDAAAPPRLASLRWPQKDSIGSPAGRRSARLRAADRARLQSIKVLHRDRARYQWIPSVPLVSSAERPQSQTLNLIASLVTHLLPLLKGTRCQPSDSRQCRGNGEASQPDDVVADRQHPCELHRGVWLLWRVQEHRRCRARATHLDPRSTCDHGASPTPGCGSPSPVPCLRWCKAAASSETRLLRWLHPGCW